MTDSPTTTSGSTPKSKSTSQVEKKTSLSHFLIILSGQNLLTTQQLTNHFLKGQYFYILDQCPQLINILQSLQSKTSIKSYVDSLNDLLKNLIKNSKDPQQMSIDLFLSALALLHLYVQQNYTGPDLYSNRFEDFWKNQNIDHHNMSNIHRLNKIRQVIGLDIPLQKSTIDALNKKSTVYRGNQKVDPQNSSSSSASRDTTTPTHNFSHTDIINHLSLNGEPIYSRVRFPLGLVLSYNILFLNGESGPFLFNFIVDPHFPISLYWWKSRLLHVYQNLFRDSIAELSKSRHLALERTKSCLETFQSDSSDIFNTHQILKAKFFLEMGYFYHSTAHFNDAKKWFNKAKDATMFEFSVTGASGKLTKFQQKDTALLIVSAKSNQKGGDDAFPFVQRNFSILDRAPKTAPDSANTTNTKDLSNIAPEELINEDLKNLRFQVAKLSDKQEMTKYLLNLREIDQLTLLAFCLDIKEKNASSSLTRGQQLSFISRILNNANNWMIHSYGLYLRSQLDMYTHKTIPRGIMQMDAIVDQVDDEPEALIYLRMCHFWQLNFPPLWEIQKTVGMQLLKYGAPKSALERFKKLGMIEEAVLALMKLGQITQAKSLVQSELEKYPTHELWCLWGDLHGGTIESYQKAWELKPFARAQRSMANSYFKRNDFVNASTHFQIALKINPSFANEWFNYGISCLQTKQWEQGAFCFRECIRLSPDDSQSWSNLAACYMHNYQKQEAYIALSKATSLSYDNWRIWDNMLPIALDTLHIASALESLYRLFQLNIKALDLHCLEILVKIIVEDIPGATGVSGRHYEPQVRKFFRIFLDLEHATKASTSTESSTVSSKAIGSLSKGSYGTTSVDSSDGQYKQLNPQYLFKLYSIYIDFEQKLLKDSSEKDELILELMIDRYEKSLLENYHIVPDKFKFAFESIVPLINEAIRQGKERKVRSRARRLYKKCEPSYSMPSSANTVYDEFTQLEKLIEELSNV